MTISATTPLLIASLLASSAGMAQPADTGLRPDWKVVLRPEASPGQGQPSRVGNPPNEVVRRAAFKTKNGCWIIGMPYEGYREDCVADSFSLRRASAGDSDQAAQAAARVTPASQASVLWVSNSPAERTRHNLISPQR